MNIMQRLLVVVLLAVIALLTHNYFCDWRETNVRPIITLKKTYITRQKITFLQNEERAHGADGEIYNPYAGHFVYYGITSTIGLREGMFGTGRRTALILGIILPLLLTFAALFVILGSPELLNMLRRKAQTNLNKRQSENDEEFLSKKTSEDQSSTYKTHDSSTRRPDARSDAVIAPQSAMASRTAPADPKPATSNQGSMVVHALGMLIAAPLTLGLMYGLLTGFTSPRSAAFAILKFTEWLGGSALALAVAFIILFLRRTVLSWIVLLVLIVLSANSVHYTKKMIARDEASARQAISTPQASTRDHTNTSHDDASRPTRLPQITKGLTVTEFVQDSQGVTEADIGPEFISEVEDFLVKDKQSQYERVMKSFGKQSSKTVYSAGSQLVREGQHRLVVTELKHNEADQGNPAIKIAWWIQGAELKLVQCADTAGGPISIRTGSCGHQIADTFGFSDWLRDK